MGLTNPARLRASKERLRAALLSGDAAHLNEKEREAFEVMRVDPFTARWVRKERERVAQVSIERGREHSQRRAGVATARRRFACGEVRR